MVSAGKTFQWVAPTLDVQRPHGKSSKSTDQPSTLRRHRIHNADSVETRRALDAGKQDLDSELHRVHRVLLANLGHTGKCLDGCDVNNGTRSRHRSAFRPSRKLMSDVAGSKLHTTDVVQTNMVELVRIRSALHAHLDAAARGKGASGTGLQINTCRQEPELPGEMLWCDDHQQDLADAAQDSEFQCLSQSRVPLRNEPNIHLQANKMVVDPQAIESSSSFAHDLSADNLGYSSSGGNIAESSSDQCSHDLDFAWSETPPRSALVGIANMNFAAPQSHHGNERLTYEAATPTCNVHCGQGAFAETNLKPNVAIKAGLQSCSTRPLALLSCHLHCSNKSSQIEDNWDDVDYWARPCDSLSTSPSRQPSDKTDNTLAVDSLLFDDLEDTDKYAASELGDQKESLDVEITSADRRWRPVAMAVSMALHEVRRQIRMTSPESASTEVVGNNLPALLDNSGLLHEECLRYHHESQNLHLDP